MTNTIWFSDLDYWNSLLPWTVALPRTERNQLEGDYCPLPRAEHSRGTDWCKKLQIEEKDQPVLGQGALGWDGTGWDGMGWETRSVRGTRMSGVMLGPRESQLSPSDPLSEKGWISPSKEKDSSQKRQEIWNLKWDVRSSSWGFSCNVWGAREEGLGSV